MTERKFNVELAKKVVAAVREAMNSSEEIDPGYTRKNPNLPEVIKQTYSWEVDPKELERFETVIDLLVCSLFGVDCDGDRSLNWLFVNRKTDDTPLPFLRVPRVKHDERNEDKYWQQVYSLQGNLAAIQKQLDTSIRIYHEEREKNQRKRIRKQRAKGCDECKETGWTRVTYDEQKAYEAKRISNERFLPTGRIDCPKCQQPALIEKTKQDELEDDEY